MNTCCIFLLVISVAILFVSPAHSDSAKTLPIYDNGAPGALGNRPEDIPTLTLYLPAPTAATDSAIIVCPGGGYGGLAAHEGKPIAEWLNSLGITAAVLTYRLGPKYHYPEITGDAARAVRLIRSMSTSLKLDPNKIGIIGFSAGGHLAATIATHFDAGNPSATDTVDRFSSRPDAAMLIYPVITMKGPYANAGTRNNLLGEKPSSKLIYLLSNELQVTKNTPPCFLVTTFEDNVVPMENSMLFAEALRKAGVPVELHVFEKGAHGFGLGDKNHAYGAWPEMCEWWLKNRNFIH
jgi:acetyl esterase/lipase